MERHANQLRQGLRGRPRKAGLTPGVAAAAGLAVSLATAPGWARQDVPPPPTEPPVVTPPGVGAQPQVTPRAEGQPPAEDAAKGAQPLGADAAEAPPPPPPPTPQPEGQPPMIEFNFPGEVELMILVNYVRDELGLQVILTDPGIQGKRCVLTAPVKVPEDKILLFLTMLLEQNGYTIVRNELGIYLVQPNQGVPSTSALETDPFGATQIIATPGMKPSAVVQYISSAVSSGGAAAGQGGGNLIPLDELGLLLVTDSPRRTQLIRDLVERLVEERSRVQFMRFEVKHIAASIARDRILALIGSAPETGLGQFIQPQQPGAKGAPGVAQPISVGAPGQTSTNFSELRLDPQSNALLFMGRAADGAYIEQMLALVDAPNTLVSRWYPVGGQAAEAIAAAASREGLGDITYQETEGVTQPVGAPGLNVPQAGFQQFGQQGQRGLQGSGFVIYPESGGFMYHGTLTQHARVDALVGELEPLTRGEQIVYEFYKLKYAKAEDVAEIIQNLLSNQLPTGNEGAILGRDLGAGRDRLGSQRDRAIRAAQQAQQQQQQQPGGEGQAAIFGDENTFVLADEKNNQIVVKAVQRVQPQFHDLIQRLDLRRPQVFINAKIIAVTDSMNFRLAVETQIIAGQFGLNTDFGLSRFGDNSFTQPKMVDTGLAGLTSALVKSEYVPFILHALQNNTDARVLATPQLLVDANEEAEISSVNVVPTQVSSQSNSTTITSQGEDATAGTTLIVTPQISESSVKLDLDITQSSFTGAPSAPGLAPPSLENHLASASVTVPPDATVVIGGLTLESVQNTIIKVPLLGDIPLVKHLFRDTNKSSQRATLYVFLTPTIMRDPNFADLRLLTRGPMAAVRLEPEVEVPPAEPISARILEPAPQRIETVPAGPSVKP